MENIIFKSTDSLQLYNFGKQKAQYICNVCGKIDQKRFDILKRSKIFKCRSCQAKYARSKVDISKIDFEKRNQKSKETCLKKYGVSSVNSLQWKKDETKKHNLEKYGCHPSQLQSVKDKQAQTNFEKYGRKSAFQSEQVKQTFRDNCEKKYGKGITNPFQVEEVKEKIKQTCLVKYGAINPKQNSEVQKKYKQTCLKKYGATCNWGNHDNRIKCQQAYTFENRNFDSGWELELYIYLKDKGEEFEYQPNIYFEYEFDGKIHRYFPDFKIDNIYYEIKGNQFLKEDGTWQNPYDHSQDALYEAKHQCLLKNNIKILNFEDLENVRNYINENYSKNYIKNFKNKEEE